MSCSQNYWPFQDTWLLMDRLEHGCNVETPDIMISICPLSESVFEFLKFGCLGVNKRRHLKIT